MRSRKIAGFVCVCVVCVCVVCVCVCVCARVIFLFVCVKLYQAQVSEIAEIPGSYGFPGFFHLQEIDSLGLGLVSRINVRRAKLDRGFCARFAPSWGHGTGFTCSGGIFSASLCWFGFS